ncbi:MAG: HEAT repeat domain-containing protein [Balneolales bacterium]|nr:HEAT repeat domain-containing protein [Balneolales bacterium]
METLAFQFILSTTLVLITITMYLFASSVLVRNAHKREEYLIERKKEELYPIILSYMIEDNDDMQQLEEHVKGKVDIHVLLTIMYEIMDSVEGDEIDRLKDILAIDVVRQDRRKLLRSKNVENRIQACAYYSRLARFDEEEFIFFERFLYSDKLMLAHTAATALMSAENIDYRFLALSAMMKRKRVSRMAILDLLYQFHNRHNDQMDEEAEKLLAIIHDRSLPTDNIAVCIKAICEIGYVTIAMDLFELLESGYWNKSGNVTEALIYAMGRFELGFTADSIAERYLSDPRVQVRRAAVEALERFQDESLINSFHKAAKDTEFIVRLKSIYALAGFGEIAKPILNQLAQETDEMRLLIRGVRAEVEG